MQPNEIKYKIKTATEKDICSHLQKCNNNFKPHLSERIDISEYSKKLFDKSITFEAWQNDVLTGLIATYLNQKDQSAFITNISVLKKFIGLGISSELLNMCIVYVSKNNIKEIILEVNQKNDHAIELYKKFDFIQHDIKGDELMMKLYISNTFIKKNGKYSKLKK